MRAARCAATAERCTSRFDSIERVSKSNRASASVWTGDKGNSQTGDMGDSGEADMRRVLVFGGASRRQAADAGSAWLGRGEVEEPEFEEAKESFPLAIDLRAWAEPDGQGRERLADSPGLVTKGDHSFGAHDSHLHLGVLQREQMRGHRTHTGLIA